MDESATTQVRPAFHLEINSLEDFVAFVTLLRGQVPDAATIAQEMARLQAGTDTLAAAVHTHQP